MYQFLFKNRWIALGFAALTLISVYIFVSSSENGGMPGLGNGVVADATGQVEEQIAVIEAPPEAVMEDSAYDEAYLSDEELIDDARGFDPSPESQDDDFAEAASQPEVIDGIPVIMQSGE